MKTCLECGEEKPLDSFYKDKRRKDNHGIYCKLCWKVKYCSSDEHKAARRLAVKKHWDSKSNTVEFKQQRRTNQLKVLYNLTREQYDDLLSRQNNKCAICLSEFSDRRVPFVDHDHSCCKGNKSCGNCVRGLLCNLCNRALGYFQDNPATLDKAAAYIRSHYP